MAEKSDSPQNIIHVSVGGQTLQLASVIQSTPSSRSLANTEYIKLPSIGTEGNIGGTANEESDSARRHEMISRGRPIYRKLYNDLTIEPQTYTISKIEDDSSDGQITQDSNDTGDEAGLGLDGSQTYQIVTQDESAEHGLQTLTMSNMAGGGGGSSAQSAVLQYGPDGQIFMSVHPMNTSGMISFPQGLMVSSGGVGINNSGSGVEESSRKRELRLLKNKEAAKECRRKKKEYVKCLENRVAILENQNKTLIEELKSLKELYCQKEVHS